jgi:hypothetical protein
MNIFDNLTDGKETWETLLEKDAHSSETTQFKESRQDSMTKLEVNDRTTDEQQVSESRSGKKLKDLS